MMREWENKTVHKSSYTLKLTVGWWGDTWKLESSIFQSPMLLQYNLLVTWSIVSQKYAQFFLFFAIISCVVCVKLVWQVAWQQDAMTWHLEHDATSRSFEYLVRCIISSSLKAMVSNFIFISSFVILLASQVVSFLISQQSKNPTHKSWDLVIRSLTMIPWVLYNFFKQIALKKHSFKTYCKTSKLWKYHQ